MDTRIHAGTHGMWDTMIQDTGPAWIQTDTGMIWGYEDTGIQAGIQGIHAGMRGYQGYVG